MPSVSRRDYAKRVILPALPIIFNQLTLALLVSRVGANNPDHTLTPHYLAVAAQLFYRCPDFHNDLQTGNALGTEQHRLNSFTVLTHVYLR
jgi:hypothetical protein